MIIDSPKICVFVCVFVCLCSPSWWAGESDIVFLVCDICVTDIFLSLTSCLPCPTVQGFGGHAAAPVQPCAAG